jgi:hypothetical protein
MSYQAGPVSRLGNLLPFTARQRIMNRSGNADLSIGLTVP